MNTSKIIIDIGSHQLNKAGQVVCGDTFLLRKVSGENRYVAVLSDGLGSGIKASVLSTMTASMALNFRLRHEPIVQSAIAMMNALPVDSQRNISYATFTIVDVDFEGGTTVVEYGNPRVFVERGGTWFVPPKEKIEVDKADGKKYISVSTFNLMENDRLIVVSDGVTQSGIGQDAMPFGWGNLGLAAYIEQLVLDDPTISSKDLARLIVHKAEQNDGMKPQDDTSCAVIYRRVPRRLLICSGPPYHETQDRYLAETVARYEGRKILCGGTTAKIISRELSREITVAPLGLMPSELPPQASMEGIDLITEGILTLGKVAEMLERPDVFELKSSGPAAAIVHHLLNADWIDLIVGTRINEAHQDPRMPVELEIRRFVIKRIIQLVEEKLLKRVRVEFI